MKKETNNKRLKRKKRPLGSKNLIELKITHILPRYEKARSKDVEIHDSPLLTVWKTDNSVNFWIGGTIAVLKLEHWEEVKKELREMLLKDIKISDDQNDDEDAEDED